MDLLSLILFLVIGALAGFLAGKISTTVMIGKQRLGVPHEGGSQVDHQHHHQTGICDKIVLSDCVHTVKIEGNCLTQILQ